MNLDVAALLGVVSVLALLSLSGVLVTLQRRRRAPSAVSLTLFVASLTLWCAVELLPPLLEGSALAVGFANTAVSVLLFVAAVSVPVFWFWYAMEYTGRGSSVTSARLGLLAAPAATAIPVGILLQSADSLLTPVAESVLALLLFLEVIYAIALLFLGGYLLARLSVTYRQASSGQVAALAVAVAAPYVGSFTSNATLGRGGEMMSLLAVDATPIGFFLAGTLLLGAVWRYPLVGVLPEAESIARDDVVEQLQEAVVVLDRNGVIIDFNAAAESVLGRPSAAALGESVESVLGRDVASLEAATRPVDVATDDGLRQFDVNVSALGGSTDPIGRTVVLRDVTERKTREQRLAVLNRVLRHNLRNDLDVILAHAGTIDDPDTRNAIREPAAALIGKAKKARDTERLLEADSVQANPVDVRSVAESVAQALRTEYETCEIVVDVPEDLAVQSRDSVVDHVLTELIGNAVEHSDQESPRVDVTASRAAAPEGMFELAVADDGSGIPEHERHVLGDGVESPLRHGSGVGLWLVEHAVSHLGGDVSFAENDPRGSTITVRLPDGQCSATGS